MKMIRLLMLVAMLLPAYATANGFDDTFTVRHGDFNADGYTDLYIKGTPSAFVPISVDDISFVVPVRAVPKDFVLIQGADHWLRVDASLTPAQRAALSNWPLLNVKLVTHDFNTDGAKDLYIEGLPDTIGALDQIVFASKMKGRHAPLTTTAVDEQSRFFFKTVYDWVLDNDSLKRGEFKIVGVEPAQRTWIAALPDNPSASIVSVALGLCPSGSSCTLTTNKPANCVQTVDNYDEAGNYIGTSVTNVCLRELHLWAYAPGTIRLVRDESYHRDAVTFIDAFEEVANGSVTDFPRITSSLSLFNAYLGISPPH